MTTKHRSPSAAALFFMVLMMPGMIFTIYNNVAYAFSIAARSPPSNLCLQRKVLPPVFTTTTRVRSNSNNNDYLDDVATNSDDDDEEEEGNDDSGNGFSSRSSAAEKYLKDAAYKQPESYLDDMSSNSDVFGDDNGSSETTARGNYQPASDYLSDTPAGSSRLDEAKSILDGIGGDDKANEVDLKEADATSTSSTQQILAELLQIAARTGRGELATLDDKAQAEKWISILESKNPTLEPTKSPMINGRWELLYSSTQLFRSSPFFMAGRAVCTTDDQAQQYDWFCDMHRKALAISAIGSVRQIVSPTLLVSEFEVKVGAIPFFNFTPFTPFPYSGGLPFTIDGAIVSSADISPSDAGNAWELCMDTVQIQGSNVPGLRGILDDGLKLQSRQLASFLEQNVDGYTTPRPLFETTYLSENLRVSRDQDAKVFVYQKVSDNTSPTDYSKVEADLGLLKFLEGLNDNVIKYYE